MPIKRVGTCRAAALDMAASEVSAVYDVQVRVEERMSCGSLGPGPLPSATLGCWGLAHLTGAWTLDGRPRLIGRELESIRLLHALDTVVRQHSPYVVTLSGPAGMGKSRLIDETLVLARVSGFGDRTYSVSALPSDQSGALMGRLLRARLKLDADDDPSVQAASLLQQVSEVLGDHRVGDVCAFLGKLLGLTLEETPLAKALSHDAFHVELALESILCELFSADARQAPICLVVEDLQHADPDSLAMLMALLDGLNGGAMSLCSARPEFFARHEHFSQFAAATHEHIELAPLDCADVRALMRQMLPPGVAQAPQLVSYMLQSALGNPGLMQRTTTELWSRGALEIESLGAPPTLRPELLPPVSDLEDEPDVLETRIYSLTREQRTVLEAAAIAGPTCRLGLLLAMSRSQDRPSAEHDRAETIKQVDGLVAAGHLLELPDSKLHGDREYLFRRPSERELLTRQMTNAARRSQHKACAEWLTGRPELRQSSEQTGQLARHLAASGASYRAALHYLEAGELARREGSGTQAAVLFCSGLNELGDQDHRRRIDGLHDYGAVLAELGRPAAARVAFCAMLDLADQLGLPSKQGAALNRLGRVHLDCGDLQQARWCFERARAAFELAGDARGVSATADDLGRLLWLEGDHRGAVPLLRKGLAERKAIGERRSLAVSLANVALVWDEQGRRAVAEEALSVAHRLFGAEGDQRGQCDALLNLGRLATYRQDYDTAGRYFRDATALATVIQDRPRLARSLLELGETALRRNAMAEAEPHLLRAVKLAEAVEAWLVVAEAQRALAKLLLKRRRLDEARKNIRASLHLARRSRCRAQLASTLRTLAEVAAAGAWSASTAGRAVGYYMQSIELAKQTQNDLELAKGYRSFARFAERYEMPEIKEQSRMLRELSEEIFRRREVKS